MADIFISYSKQSKAEAAQLANELQAKGFTVWYDTSLVAGDSFGEVILSELAQARAVIVIWDAASVKSEWVRSEASRARARRILIPVRAEGIRSHDIPPPFDSLHTELLSNREAIEVALVKLGVTPMLAMKDKLSARPTLLDDDSAPPLALPDKPSIAVLPFRNMSGDPEQEYFADGVVEDIITALSRIPSIFVIARNSSFAYKGKAVDIRQIGRELGVRYVLEGSVRKAGQRLRITGQLVEAETGAHLWADRFDSSLEDVFDLQDLVTMAVAGVIEPSIREAEIRRANRKPTENLQAYDWLLRALGEHQLFSREGIDRGMEMARRAIALDPRYAHAYAYLASWIQLRKIYGWMEDEAAETAEGVRFAHLAVQLEPNDSIVLTEAAFALGHLNRDLVTAIPWFDKAIALNPNSAMAFGRGAVVRNFLGDYITAADHADRAMRLSPFDSYSFAFSQARGLSHLLRRQVPEAVTWLRKAAQQNPRHSATFLFLGSALAHAGQLEEGRAAIGRLLELHPTSTVRWRREHRLFPEDDYEYVLDGARRVGLPE